MTAQRILMCLVLMCTLSCSSSPVDPVDEELMALDLSLCMKPNAACSVDGTVTPIESLLPNEERAVAMSTSSRIESRLLRPMAAKRLKYLVVGVRARGLDWSERRLDIQVQGQPNPMATVQLKLAGFHRVEIAVDFIPSPDASIVITNKVGEHEIIYVQGRWLKN